MAVLVLLTLAFIIPRMYSEKVLNYALCKVSGEDRKLTARATDLFKKLKISGSVLISKDGKILSKIHCGTSDPKNGMPVSDETAFNIGSVTKQFTGYVILELKRENKLSLSDPISKYIPEIGQKPMGQITVSQLANMTGGISYVLPTKDFIKIQFSDRIRSLDEMISEIALLDLESQPGQRFNYSNLGYSLLGVIISRIEKMSWAESLRKRIFDPFKMVNTTTEGDSPERPENLATGLLPLTFHSKVFFLALPHWNYSMIKGAGGIVSTVDDLHLWNEALTRKAIADPVWASEYFPHGVPGDENYSFGWIYSENALLDESKVKTFNHGGEDPGYCGTNIRIAEANANFMLTTNSDYCALKDHVYRPLIRAVLTYLYSGSEAGFE